MDNTVSSPDSTATLIEGGRSLGTNYDHKREHDRHDISYTNQHNTKYRITSHDTENKAEHTIQTIYKKFKYDINIIIIIISIFGVVFLLFATGSIYHLWERQQVDIANTTDGHLLQVWSNFLIPRKLLHHLTMHVRFRLGPEYSFF